MPGLVVASLIALGAVAVVPTTTTPPGECAGGTEWNELRGECVPKPIDPNPDSDPGPTATWSVSWVASDGRSRDENPILLSNSVAYDVDEIQTVGASG